MQCPKVIFNDGIHTGGAVHGGMGGSGKDWAQAQLLLVGAAVQPLHGVGVVVCALQLLYAEHTH